MKLGAIGVLAAGAVLALALPAAGAAARPAAGRVVTELTQLPSNANYNEGAVQQVAIRRAVDGRVVARTQRGSSFLNVALPAGRYRLSSASRVCQGNCGSLAPPSLSCTARFRLPAGVTLRARIGVGAGIRCRARVVPHVVGIGGTTATDRRQGSDLLRYLRRNAGAAAWFPALRRVDVRNRVFSVRTSLQPSRPAARAAAREICSAIQGSDTADFVAGHRVTGRASRVVARCAARRS